MRFSRDTLARFSSSSRDINPLHMSDSYARTTPFGERVVHGACAALACCGQFEPPREYFPSRLRAVFYQPVFLDLDYDANVSWTGKDRTLINLMDVSTQVLEITLDYSPGIPTVATLSNSHSVPRVTARIVTEADLSPPWNAQGQYSPSRPDYLALIQMLGVHRDAWGDTLPFTLLGTSYLTGMELPGERAMCFQMHAELTNNPIQLPATFQHELTSFDQRWSMVKSHFRFSNGNSTWSKGEIHAFLRPVPTRITAPPIDAIDPRLSAELSGKKVLVVGASRGLGASLVLTFVAMGATVIGLYACSCKVAERLKDAAEGLPGRVLLTQCDATDPVECRKVCAEVLKDYGRLDWLVCSAAPSLRPLRVEAAAFDRFNEFLGKGLRLVLAPMMAFLDLIAKSSGSVLLISSIFVEDPPPIWPHYVMLKCAVEALVRTAAAECPKVSFCIARPGKLLTDQTNAPMTRVNAESPASAALCIISNAVTYSRPGVVCYVK
jgi:NAD(P)-dependent dehydrogenase (short-subunit alcohol dehydrogenase family)